MSLISQTKAEGSDISLLVELLSECMEGVPDGHQVIALLATALIVQKPDLTEEQVRDGVREMSQLMCLWLDGTTPEPVSDDAKKRLLN